MLGVVSKDLPRNLSGQSVWEPRSFRHLSVFTCCKGPAPWLYLPYGEVTSSDASLHATAPLARKLLRKRAPTTATGGTGQILPPRRENASQAEVLKADQLGSKVGRPMRTFSWNGKGLESLTGHPKSHMTSSLLGVREIKPCACASIAECKRPWLRDATQPRPFAASFTFPNLSGGRGFL